MYRIRVQNLLIFVSILGLLACTPDKLKKREDQWRFAPPEIVMPGIGDGADRARIKVGEASQKELPLDAELAFPVSGANVVLEIDSICSWSDQHFEEDFRLETPAKLELGSLVPARALLEVTDQVVECSFSFSAINEHGSRHHFLIPGVKLAGGASYGKLIVSEKLQRISPAAPGASQITIDVKDLDQLAVDSDVLSGTAELICSDFTSREYFRSVDTINWKLLAYKQPIEVLENVLRKFRQPCRLALKDESGVRLEISAAFVIRYPPPAVQIITSTTPLQNGHDGGRRDASILNLKISNTSNIDQTFALANLTVPIRLVFAVKRNARDQESLSFLYSPFRHPTADIFARIEGAEKTISANGKTIFVLKAKSEASVTIVANAYYNYLMHHFTHAGYLFIFAEPLRLERLEVTGDLDTAIRQGKIVKAGDIQLFTTLAHHFHETQVYLPHELLKTDWSLVARSMREGNLPSTGD